MLDKKNQTRQTRINFYTNIVTLAVNVVIALVYTPYLVDRLGVAAYGILPLALIINQYIGIVTSALTNSYTRFYSVAIQKQDYNGASNVLSTSIIAILAIILCVTPLCAGLIIKVDAIFQIPAGYTASAQYLFLYTILSFIVSLVSSLLNVTLYAQNRLDWMNFIKIVRSVLKLAIVWALFECFEVNVAFVGLSGLVTECLILFLSTLLFYKTKPADVRINIKLFDKAILTAIVSMSVWVLVQHLGDALLYRTDNILFNIYLGPDASGRLGAISSLGDYTMQITSVVGALFGPLIIIAYSKDCHEEVKSLAMAQSKIVGCLSAILCGVIAGVGGPLLSLWLDSSFTEYSDWLMIKLLPLPFYAAGGILAFVYRAWNKVKFPAIATIILGFIDVGLIVLSCALFNNGKSDFILYISAVFSIIQSYILNSFCVSRIYPGVQRKSVNTFLSITLVSIGTYFIATFISNLWRADDFFILLVQMTLSALVAFVLLLYLVFDKQERNNLFSLIR